MQFCALHFQKPTGHGRTLPHNILSSMYYIEKIDKQTRVRRICFNTNDFFRAYEKREEISAADFLSSYLILNSDIPHYNPGDYFAPSKENDRIQDGGR